MATYSIRDAVSQDVEILRVFFWSEKQAHRELTEVMDDLFAQFGSGSQNYYVVPVSTWRETMMSVGKFFVILVFAVAMCFLALHFFPSIGAEAFKAPTYSQQQGIRLNGWSITGTMLVFAAMFAGGWKLVRR